MRLFAVVAILLPVAGQADVLVARTTDAANGGVVVTEQWSGTAPAPARDVTLIPMPNWPKQVGVGSMYRPSGVTLADINGDDTLEVIVGSTDNTVHVWDYHGNSMPGWPKTIPGAVQSKVAVGDLYGDGRAVLFVMSRNGSCYAFKADGGAVPGWPQSAGGSGGFVSPTLSDLDGNDTLEVIGVQYPPGTVYVWKADGTVYPGWPKSLDYLAVATASVGDVDADGTMEICVPSYRSLYLWDKDGNIEPGWPISIGDGASYSQPLMYDLDSDGKLEIGFSSGPNTTGTVFVFRYNGTSQPGWPNYMAGPQPYVCPVAGSFDGDTLAYSLFCGAHLFGGNGFYGWDAGGGSLPGWPVQPDFLECSPVVFGIEGPDDMGVMIASNTTPGALYAYNMYGELIEGFPVATPAAALPNSPAVADVDLDRNMEVALFTMDGTVSLWTVDESHHPHTIVDWGCWFHDNWHTGWLHPAAPTGLSVARGNPGARLYWRPNPEPDVKGYRVYRGGGPSGWFERLFDRPISDTTYLDTTAVGDTVRSYCVTAIIRAGNESRQSDGVLFNPTGVAEKEMSEVRREKTGIAFIRGVLWLAPSPSSGPSCLLDAAGRKVLDLLPGANDVRRLAPGVYFVRSEPQAASFKPQAVRRVVVTR